MISRFTVLIVLFTLWSGAAAAAASATDAFDLSHDGIQWGPALAAPLFAPDTLWVPGDTRTATFYVRNIETGPAELIIDVTATDGGKLMETGDVQISAGGQGVWTTASTAGVHRLMTSANLLAGSVTPVQVQVAFASKSENISQGRSVELQFHVTLSDFSSADASGPAGMLPATGADQLMWFAVPAAVLAGMGLAFCVRRQRRIEVSNG